MRVTTEFWVKALLRRATSGGAMAAVVRHGDDKAGAVFLKVNRLDGRAILFGPAPAGWSQSADERKLIPLLEADGNPEPDVDDYLRRQVEYDPDLWLIEVEDKAGRSFLGD